MLVAARQAIQTYFPGLSWQCDAAPDHTAPCLLHQPCHVQIIDHMYLNTTEDSITSTVQTVYLQASTQTPYTSLKSTSDFSFSFRDVTGQHHNKDPCYMQSDGSNNTSGSLAA